MTKTKLVLIIAIVVALIYAAFAFDIPYRSTVDDFDTCVAAGNGVMESFPRQCRDKNGNLYREEVGGTISSSDKVFLESLASGAKISSPVKLSGQARGPWYFEASFPIEVVAADRVTVLGQGHATAKGEWMTSAFVPYTATVQFDRGTQTSGFIRLKRDNPSGDPVRDEHVDIPVAFATSTGR